MRSWSFTAPKRQRKHPRRQLERRIASTSRNVFLKTLRDLRWTILVWSVGLGIIVTMDIVFYPQYSQTPQQLSEMTKAYEAFGFLLGETVPVNSLGAFLTLETLAYFPVMLGLWGIV